MQSLQHVSIHLYDCVFQLLHALVSVVVDAGEFRLVRELVGDVRRNNSLVQ